VGGAGREVGGAGRERKDGGGEDEGFLFVSGLVFAGSGMWRKRVAAVKVNALQAAVQPADLRR
jgi:hypothetical protein